MQSAARTKTAEWLQNRDGFSEYKNFERELISYCRVQIYCWTYYNMSMYKWKSGKLAYKTGFSFTKWDSRLQNEIFIYKEGLLRYKRDSCSTFHRFSLHLDNDVIYLHHMLEIYHIEGHYYEQRKTYSVSNSKIHAPIYHQWLFVAPLLNF